MAWSMVGVGVVTTSPVGGWESVARSAGRYGDGGWRGFINCREGCYALRKSKAAGPGVCHAFGGVESDWVPLVRPLMPLLVFIVF